MNKLRSFLSPYWSAKPLSKVVTDSSEFIDGVPGRRISGLYTDTFAGVSRRSRSVWYGLFGSPDRRRFGETLGREFGLGSPRFHMLVQVTSASETSSEDGIGAPDVRSSGIGRKVPPRRTVSTAAWHTCQLPVHKSPTAPFTGFTVLPQASNNKDWNKAEKHNQKKKIRTETITQVTQPKKKLHSIWYVYIYIYICTRSLRFRYVGNERHKASTTKELGHEDSGVALGFGGIDPLQARP